MRYIPLIFLVALTLSCASVTPGDAALRAGQVEQAASLYEKVATNNKDALAAKKLANIYNYGIVGDKTNFKTNKEKAIYWYKKSLEYGDRSGNWFIGSIYREGKGNVPQDFIKAEQWFLKGANIAQHSAMFDLASMHAKNEVTTPNDIEGLKWLNLAQTMAKSFSKNNAYAQDVLKDKGNIRKTLESRMSKSDINNAKALSEAFIKQHRKSGQ